MSRLISLRNANCRNRIQNATSTPSTATARKNTSVGVNVNVTATDATMKSSRSFHTQSLHSTSTRSRQIHQFQFRHYHNQQQQQQLRNSSNNPMRMRKENLRAIQLDLNMNSLNANNVTSNSMTWNELSAWILKQVKVPKGFENFFPKNKGPTPKSTKKNGSSSSKEASSKKKDNSKKEETKSNPFDHFKKNKKAGGSGGGGKNNNNDEQSQVMTAGALLLLVLAARSMLDDDVNGNGGLSGREITWSDFYNHILEPGDVDKIVVINGKTARVFLKPGSPGVPIMGNARGSATSSSPSGMENTSTPRSNKRSSSSSDPFGDETVMEMGQTSVDSDTTTKSSLQRSIMPGGGDINSHRRLVYHFHIGSVESFEEKLTTSQQELGVAPRDYVSVQYASETNWGVELLKSAPAILMIGLMAFMMRGMGGMGGAGGRGGGGMGGIFQVGKSNAKKIKKEEMTVTFKDVAGCQEAKREIMEFVDFLKDSSRFTRLGAKIPKGALLCGPPGTGKTLLAKAVAGEASVPFFSISGSDFIEMFVGVGPSRVRDLFKEARAEAPCIIFIDEIDAVGRKRGAGNMSGGNDERENTLNQLLVEMDGFSPSTGVVVLAGTNRVDILDEALTRPGRFDRQVQVDKPDLEGRKEIFMVHLQGIKLDGKPEEFAGRLAGLTPGFTGADIANICNEAAIVAARRKAEAVSPDDFEKATDRIVGGLESNKIMSKEERSIVAHHEAGHAVAGWFLEHADPLLKVTIIPRSSGALGYAQYLPKEVFLRTEEQIMHIVMMALAGRAAEEVFFGNVTTGASDDLRRVTELVYSTIQVYGMNSRVGQLAFPKDPNAYPGDKPYSDSTAEAMDEEARRIVDDAYTKTVQLITEKKADVENVANLLLDKETITHDDLIDLVGPRPFTGNEAYNEYVSKRPLAKKDPEEDEADKEGQDDDDKVEAGNNVNSGLTPGLAFKA